MTTKKTKKKAAKPEPRVKPVKAWAIKRWITRGSLSNSIYGLYRRRDWLTNYPVTIVPGHVGKDFTITPIKGRK